MFLRSRHSRGTRLPRGGYSAVGGVRFVMGEGRIGVSRRRVHHMVTKSVPTSILRGHCKDGTTGSRGRSSGGPRARGQSKVPTGSSGIRIPNSNISNNRRRTPSPILQRGARQGGGDLRRCPRRLFNGGIIGRHQRACIDDRGCRQIHALLSIVTPAIDVSYCVSGVLSTRLRRCHSRLGTVCDDHVGLGPL